MEGRIGSTLRPGLFEGRVVIVSGGGTGIGNTITQELLFLAHMVTSVSGANVVIAARRFDILQSEAQRLNTIFPSKNDIPRVTAVACNIRKENEIAHLMQETLRVYGRIDILVNNSGGQFQTNAEKISAKGWSAVVDTNLTGTWLMTKAVFEAYMKNHGGSIVCITAAWHYGWPNAVHSGAARAGVEHMVKTLSIEWAKYGVTLNAVAPGVIYVPSAAKYYGDPEVFHKRIPGIPLKRLGTPEEVSAAVCYLLSPAARFITGTTVKVDGAASLNGLDTTYSIPDHRKSEPYKWDQEETPKPEQLLTSKL